MTGPTLLQAHPAVGAEAPTPLFTRHMLGAIELGRDRRRRHRAGDSGLTTRYEPVTRIAALIHP